MTVEQTAQQISDWCGTNKHYPQAEKIAEPLAEYLEPYIREREAAIVERLAKKAEETFIVAADGNDIWYGYEVHGDQWPLEEWIRDNAKEPS